MPVFSLAVAGALSVLVVEILFRLYIILYAFSVGASWISAVSGLTCSKSCFDLSPVVVAVFERLSPAAKSIDPLVLQLER